MLPDRSELELEATTGLELTTAIGLESELDVQGIIQLTILELTLQTEESETLPNI